MIIQNIIKDCVCGLVWEIWQLKLLTTCFTRFRDQVGNIIFQSNHESMKTVPSMTLWGPGKKSLQQCFSCDIIQIITVKYSEIKEQVGDMAKEGVV